MTIEISAIREICEQTDDYQLSLITQADFIFDRHLRLHHVINKRDSSPLNGQPERCILPICSISSTSLMT